MPGFWLSETFALTLYWVNGPRYPVIYVDIYEIDDDSRWVVWGFEGFVRRWQYQLRPISTGGEWLGPETHRLIIEAQPGTNNIQEV